jgi:hypothetical protein
MLVIGKYIHFPISKTKADLGFIFVINIWSIFCHAFFHVVCIQMNVIFIKQNKILDYCLTGDGW